MRCNITSNVLGELEEDTLVLRRWRLSSRTWNPINLSLNEAIDVAQNRPLWRLMSTFGATHS